MKWLNVDGGRPIFLAAINLDRTGLAQLDGDDPGRRIGTKEDRVLVEFHGSQPKWMAARRRVPKINWAPTARTPSRKSIHRLRRFAQIKKTDPHLALTR